MPARPALLLALLLAACAHHDAAPEATEAPNPPAVTQAQDEAQAEPPAQPGPTAQVITFSGDDADPEPATQIRSPPKRPKLPSFQLYGTRTGDGPR